MNKKNDKIKRYELPDGQVILLEGEQFLCPEVLFAPSLNGLGIHCELANAINACPIDLRFTLLANVELIGGTGELPGFLDYLQKLFYPLFSQNVLKRMIVPTACRDKVWLGGSVFGSVWNDPGVWISKEDYQEVGPNIVNIKCTYIC